MFTDGRAVQVAANGAPPSKCKLKRCQGKRGCLCPKKETSNTLENMVHLSTDASQNQTEVETYNLERFIEAQDGRAMRGETYGVALAEMLDGTKNSCWVWYVFPQYMERSGEMNETYQIHSCKEAMAYLRHQVLIPQTSP